MVLEGRVVPPRVVEVLERGPRQLQGPRALGGERGPHLAHVEAGEPPRLRLGLAFLAVALARRLLLPQLLDQLHFIHVPGREEEGG